MFIAAAAFAQTPGVKLVSNGDFKDKDGSLHSWRIDGAHTLIWDGNPYVPVGGVFYSKYICTDQTGDNWQADVKALDSIKAAGITDLLLKTIGPATWTKPDAWQKLLDYLDASGFTYGIDLSDGPKAPLSGTIIEPSKYRISNILKDSSFTFDMPDVSSAVWVLCSAYDGAVLSSGGAFIADGKVKVDVKARPDQSSVLLLYPVIDLANGERSGVADLWAGFDEYRDRLLGFLAKVKFGKGFRFFVDPLTSKMDFAGERAALIPDSADFRLQFEAYLAKKYSNIGSLNAAWGLTSENLSSFQEAARVIPLWHGARGIPAIYDRARGIRIKIDVPRSKIWDDIIDFRDKSAQAYLNMAADLLKRNGADVPVIYNASNHHRIFANATSRGGFDGLGVQAYGHGVSLVTDTAGTIYSLAEESSKSIWFVVTGTQDTISRSQSTAGYGSKEVMFADLDSLAEIGAKGLFIYGLQDCREQGTENREQFLSMLGWLKEFKDKFTSEDRAGFVPEVVYYPIDQHVGAETMRLGPGAWWLPSLRTGSPLVLGDSIAGYTLNGQDGACLWSRIGSITATLPLTQDQKPKLVFPNNADGVFTADKKKVVLKLGITPIVVSGLDMLQTFPLEVVQEEFDKLGPLVAKAKAAGNRVPDADTAIERAKKLLKSGRPAIAYDIAHTFVQQIANELGSYTWVEGEQPISSSFEGFVSGLGASAGGYLGINTLVAPPMSPYTATYVVSVAKAAMYELWLAGTTLDAGASSFSFCMDNGPWQETAPSNTSRYWKSFAWMKIGVINLSEGQHILQIRIDKPNKEGFYKLGIDAIVLSPSEFKPNGIKRP